MPGMELRSFFFPISTYTLNTESNERAQDNELFFCSCWGTLVVPGIGWMGWNFVGSVRSSRLHVFDRLCRFKCY